MNIYDEVKCQFILPSLRSDKHPVYPYTVATTPRSILWSIDKKKT